MERERERLTVFLFIKYTVRRVRERVGEFSIGRSKMKRRFPICIMVYRVEAIQKHRW